MALPSAVVAADIEPSTSSAELGMPRGGRVPLRALCWFVSGVAFLIGPAIGMAVNAEIGAAIWVSSALFALLPFSSHRHYGSKW